MAVVGGSPESMEVCVGVEVRTEGVTKSFGSQRIWQDVSLTLPAGEVSALLGQRPAGSLGYG